MTRGGLFLIRSELVSIRKWIRKWNPTKLAIMWGLVLLSYIPMRAIYPRPSGYDMLLFVWTILVVVAAQITTLWFLRARKS